MNNSDKIAKDARILVDSVKDTLSANIVIAARNNTVDLNEVQLAKILAVINVSADEGYQKSVPTFQNMVKKYLQPKSQK